MTVTIHRLSVLCACLFLTACKPAVEIRKAETAPAPSTAPAATPPAPVTFSHDPALDSFGFYLPDKAIQSGDLKLTSLNIGQASDFADWEAGGRSATYAPIFMSFDDVASPTVENELGQIVHTVSVRVMPTAYRVDDRELSFHGVDPRLGQVTFTGAFDLEALKAAKAAGPGEPKPVMKGDLLVGDRQFRNIGFLYFGGD
ncbi:hypothetical protein ASD38_11000 [Caulobacter sp. Root487D2Y]|uniref:hypothetical protein n=1 Tax=Caulobacter sp. Root487D2Y TaxID=1736547 RepID=UPI0006F71E95|nr:hypothetical protein [Caulobacter sp. Root487D2Y]KQY29838.1 hypothetical protein ASD38_11000 [Caulobacter sp. Root487D2Y]